MATAATATPAIVQVREISTNIATVYGDMHDPTTGQWYSQKPVPYLVKSTWVQAQLDAGKMKLV